MKKSLLALAVLGAFTGVASAQSSVTLYGTVDVSAKYVKNDGTTRRYSLATDGLNSSQLGFRGTEDLGGGLKASFVLLSSVAADAGTIGSGVANNKFFNRRATVSLMGNFGEVRLGRDYTPTFWNNTIFDPFGTNGLGDSLSVVQLASPTLVRADNSIAYHLPSNIGGLYGQFTVAAAEPPVNATTSANGGRYLGGRVGFAAGPFDVAGAYGVQRFNAGGSDQKTLNVGASFALGPVKLMGYFDRDKLGSIKENRYLAGVVVPFGQSEIHASYVRSKISGRTAALGNEAVNKFAVGYVYSLSKRTALYGTVAVQDNGGNTATGAALALGGGNPGLTRGGKSQGAEAGVRHFF